MTAFVREFGLPPTSPTITESAIVLFLPTLAPLFRGALLASAMRIQEVPTPEILSPLSCGMSVTPSFAQTSMLTALQPNCQDLKIQPPSATPDVFGDADTNTPAMVWLTGTSVPKIFASPGTGELDSSTSSINSSDSSRSLTNSLPNSPVASSTMASPPTTRPLIIVSALPISSFHNEDLSSATSDVSLRPKPTATSNTGIPFSKDAISGAASSPQLPLSLAAATPTSDSGPDYAPPPFTSLSTAASTTTLDAATIFSAPMTALQLAIPATPAPSSPPSISNTPTVATSPPPHNILSTAAKSGIAVSTTLLSIILLVALAFLWRKKRSAETKRRNDVEARAIWVTKTFTVETQARSSDSETESPRRFKKDSVIPAEWATMGPSEDARVARRRADMDVVGGLTRWSKARKGVHESRG